MDYATDPATAATTVGTYEGVRSERSTPTRSACQFDAADAALVRRRRRRRTARSCPGTCSAPTSARASREAPTNLKPVGTGPYRFVDFKPGDSVRGEINPSYHLPNRPHFDTIEIKGGGDATSAARAVLQTGEYDYAWNLQVEDEVLKRMEAAARAASTSSRAATSSSSSSTRPTLEGGRRRARQHQEPSTSPSPTPRCARRWRCCCDRKGMQDFVYGRTGVGHRPTS